MAQDARVCSLLGVLAVGCVASTEDERKRGEFPCAPEARAGHQRVSCPEGVVIDVEVSDGCAIEGCGVILDVHGMLMDANEEDADTRMRALAPPLGYIVVQPTAPRSPVLRSWGLTAHHDDVVWDFLQATMTTFAVDLDRVHMMGFSQGAMMTYRMIAEHPETFASVAPISGTYSYEGPLVSAQEIPILHVHGHYDLVYPFAHATAQRDEILGAWPFGPGETIVRTENYRATRWVTSSGTPFELWEHWLAAYPPYIGHCLPGPHAQRGRLRCACPSDPGTFPSSDPDTMPPSDLSRIFPCPETSDASFDSSLEALRFFAEHPRRAR